MYWTTGILGLALAVAPFVLSYSDNTAALWTSVLVGGATIVVSLIEGLQADREQWEYWIAGILGVVAIAAPFALDFSNHATAVWTTVIAGTLIALFAGSRLTAGRWGGA